MLGCRVYDSIGVIVGLGRYIEYVKGQAVSGPVEMSVHHQAHKIVMEGAGKCGVEVLI